MTNGLSKVFDAATPPPTGMRECAGVLGYIGRPGLAARTWTPGNWQAFAHLAQFPAWVPDLANHAGTEANAIIGAARAAGFNAVPARPLAVVIDYETAGQAQAAWHSHLAQALGAADFAAVAYGSLSSVMMIGAAHVWSADWDGLAAIEPAAMTVHAHQYAANVPIGSALVDYSVADQWLMNLALHRAT